jgi:hypothetical protein
MACVREELLCVVAPLFEPVVPLARLVTRPLAAVGSVDRSATNSALTRSAPSPEQAYSRAQSASGGLPDQDVSDDETSYAGQSLYSHQCGETAIRRSTAEV